MLRGEAGRQAKELDRMVAWLAEHDRPEVVCLSNALLAGCARRVKAVLNVPVVCWLQDEDAFLDALPEPHHSRAWALLIERAREIDAFVSPSAYYAGVMRQRLLVEGGRMHVVPTGVDPSGYAPAAEPPDPPVVGYLSEMSHAKGLDLLAEAFVALRARPGLGGLRLRVAGGMTRRDAPLVEWVRRQLAGAGLAGEAEFIMALDHDSKAAFLKTLSVMCVPARHPEAFGLFALEALAAGVPVVLPRHGSFPELIERSGGGVLCEPNDPRSLCDALGGLLADPARRAEMARRGRQAVIDQFNMETMGRGALEICQSVLAASRP
jgi:glycosyltransferase involved in cell wall biosynthesis